VLRRIFGPKSEEVAGGWRKLHSEELHNLYATPNITVIGEVEMGGICSTHGTDEKYMQYFGCKT
jgi:metal-dependent hydrolase (beta-lactamase superfamily II)